MRRCLRRGNYFQIIALPTSDGGRNSSGSLAIFAAICRAPSRVNSKQKLWLFVLYLFDLKFLKMAPGTHNVATNQINTIGAVRTMRPKRAEGEFTCARSAFSPVLLLFCSWLA